MQQEAMDAAKEAEAEEEAKKEPEPEVEKGPSFFERMQMKREKLSDTVSDKYPRVYRTSSYIGGVWRETFPNQKKNARSRLGTRKEEA